MSNPQEERSPEDWLRYPIVSAGHKEPTCECEGRDCSPFRERFHLSHQGRRDVALCAGFGLPFLSNHCSNAYLHGFDGVAMISNGNGCRVASDLFLRGKYVLRNW